jgi:signal transduction histidine kinase
LLSLGLALPLGGLVLSVFLAGELFHRALVEDVDRRLLAQAAVESVSLFDGPDRKPHIHLPRSPLAREVEAFPTTSALYDPAGLLLQTSPEGASVPPTLVLDPPSLRPRIRTSSGARTLLVSVERAGEGAYTLYLSASLAPTLTTMSLFYRVVGGTVSLIGLLLAALLYHQARWLSGRLRELISAVSWLRGSRPHPGPIAPGNDELAELGQVLVEASHHIHEQQASQERFLASAAHQLRTPLTIMRTEIDLALRRERSNPQLREALEHTRAEVDRLALLARKLLDFESLRVRPLPLKEDDLGSLLQEILERMEPRSRERGVLVERGVAAGLRCRCDALLLGQAIENVIDNALRFAPEGSVVRVSAERRGASLRITIEDQGPGVPEEERSRLFRPFHRGAAAGSQTGLGLAFAAEVLRHHGGSIALAPRPPPGTTFLLEIPALADRLPGASTRGS